MPLHTYILFVKKQHHYLEVCSGITTYLTLIKNQTVQKSVENLASYGHLKSKCSTNTMLWVSQLTVARWPPCADVGLRWPATRTRHLAFMYIYDYAELKETCVAG